MATRASIEMDFNLAKNQAARLEELADRLRGLSDNRFGGTLNNISSNWKGENASAYLSKGSKLQNKMDRSSSELYQIASDIRLMAKRIYDAEMANLLIAETRD
ncbi:MAG: hypothetical protein KBS96_08810 [Lachnospiraceae bacterium]|nr:hypothetical protein [Candidatus Colinaster scatohippi]